MPLAQQAFATRKRAALASAALVGATFFVDLLMPLGVAVGVGYAIAVLFSLWAPDRRHTLVGAAVGTALTVVGALLSPEGGLGGLVLMNRSLTVLAIWATAGAVVAQQATKLGLVEALAQQQRLLDVTEALFLSIDLEGRIELANTRSGVVLGLQPSDLRGRDWLEAAVMPEHHEQARQAHQRVISGLDGPVSVELDAPGVSGARRTIGWECAPIRDAAEQVVGVLMSGIDVTSRREAQARLREATALARLGELAAVVAHEVKNPLMGISGVLQVLAGRLPPESPELPLIRLARERLDGLHQAIQHLLRYARPRQPILESLDLNRIIGELAEALEQDASGVIVEVDLEMNGPAEDPDGFPVAAIRGDAKLLQQAFLNLALNAAHAVGSGGTIRLSTRRVGLDWHVSVADSGPGIPQHARDRIFDPFFTTREDGNGLGLAIVKRTIDAHGGRIDVDSAPSAGTTFTVALPAG